LKVVTSRNECFCRSTNSQTARALYACVTQQVLQAVFACWPGLCCCSRVSKNMHQCNLCSCAHRYTDRCHIPRISANESHGIGLFKAPHPVPAGMPCREALCRWVCRFGRELGARAQPGLLLVALPCSHCWLHYSHQRPFSTLAPPPSPRRLLQSLPDLPYLSRRSSYSSSCSSIRCHTSCIHSHSSRLRCMS